VIANTGFGFVAPPADARPRHTAGQAYQIRSAQLQAGQTGDLRHQQTGPIVTLAMATMSDTLGKIMIGDDDPAPTSAVRPLGRSVPLLVTQDVPSRRRDDLQLPARTRPR
jgi:hypothetical protein